MATSHTSSKIERISGRAVVVRGDDIDTDRIIPARYLKTITFEGLGDHVFEDDRRQLAERGTTHPFDQKQNQGARILFAGSNFGCGSSREHAPQAITRWGVKAIVAVSFAEIFAGNSLMIGLPCVTVTPQQMEQLTAAAGANPATEWVIDLAVMTISGGSVTVPLTMPESSRAALRSGDWDATSLLVDRYEDVERVAANLPYVSGWDRRLA
jgi:3-isopropylmalate/(R)-2-methylmalate dehydratase small subunit